MPQWYVPGREPDLGGVPRAWPPDPAVRGCRTRLRMVPDRPRVAGPDPAVRGRRTRLRMIAGPAARGYRAVCWPSAAASPVRSVPTFR